MSLQVNTAIGTSLGPIGIVPLTIDINDHKPVQNLIICEKTETITYCGIRLCTKMQNWHRLGCLWNIIVKIQRKKDSHSNEKR